MVLSSHEQLVLGGFIFRRELVCRRCGQRVLLYASSAGEGKKILVEPRTFEPHWKKCKRTEPGDPVQEKLF